MNSDFYFLLWNNTSAKLLLLFLCIYECFFNRLKSIEVMPKLL